MRNIGRLLFSPTGRIGRRSYWLGFVIYFFGYLALVVLATVADVLLNLPVLFYSGREPYGPFAVLAMVASAVLSIPLQLKRLHDRGHGPKMYWLILIPFVGPTWLLVELFLLPGEKGANRYGPSPRQPVPPPDSASEAAP